MVEWITISSNSGNSGTTVITVSAATYSELMERTTLLTVNTVNSSLSERVTISQEPREIVSVMVSPTTISAPSTGGTYMFNIISNGEWTIEYPEWMTLSQSAGTGNTTITVNLEENFTIDELIGNIVVSTIDNSATVQVSQARIITYINVSPSTLNYFISGGTSTITVESNAPWTVSTNVDWLSFSSSAGTGNGSITVTCNTTSSERNAVINFITLDETENITVVQYNEVPYLYFDKDTIVFNGSGGVEMLGVNSNVDWEIETEDVSGGLKIIPRSSGTFRIQQQDGYNYNAYVTYSKNGYGEIRTDEPFTVNSGDVIFIKNIEKSVGSLNLIPIIKTDFYYDIIGDTEGANYPFKELFADNYLIDASNFTIKDISLIASGLRGRGMFEGCTNLVNPPILPTATTLTNYCYKNMFSGCTSLTTAPELPATILAESCYRGMFQGCTSLTTAPALPATTLAESCYYNMFYGCTSLTTAPELPATTLARYCYEYMFYGCTNLVSAPELPATTLIGSCYWNMFAGCTSLTTAPALPATTLAYGCYYGMFQNCTNLNYIKCLATDISASDCTTNWVSGVASTGTFIKAADVSWTTGTSGIPSGWTINNI